MVVEPPFCLVSSRGFDRLARFYRQMEWLLAGNKLQKCRLHFLPEITNAKRVLLLGEGHGRFIGALLRNTNAVEITCVDGSARMLAVARAALTRAGLPLDLVEFVHADALEWPFTGVYDVVVTHFFLDCFTPEQQQHLVASVAQHVVPGGIWLLADFHQPTHGLRRLRSAIILKVMYLFFRAGTGLPARGLNSPDRYLEESGFILKERHFSEWGLLHTDLWRKR